jgi:ribulose kinase
MAEELKTYFDGIGHEGISHIVAAGNAVKLNPVLQKILGKTFHSSIALTTNDEEAAFGSALFAGVACQVIGMDEVKAMIKERNGLWKKETC